MVNFDCSSKFLLGVLYPKCQFDRMIIILDIVRIGTLGSLDPFRQEKELEKQDAPVLTDSLELLIPNRGTGIGLSWNNA